MKTIACFLSILLIGLCGCDDSKPATLADSNFDQKEMDAAIAKARSKVDVFLQELKEPTGTNHAVKAPIVENGKTEHFWLTDITYENGEFQGTIGNEPGIVGNVKMGQTWKIKQAEISDWMYLRDDKMVGNYTIRPLLKTMPAETAAKFRQMLAEP